MKHWSREPSEPKMKDLQAILIEAYKDKLIESEGILKLSAFTGIPLPDLEIGSPEKLRQHFVRVYLIILPVLFLAISKIVLAIYNTVCEENFVWY